MIPDCCIERDLLDWEPDCAWTRRLWFTAGWWSWTWQLRECRISLVQLHLQIKIQNPTWLFKKKPDALKYNPRWHNALEFQSKFQDLVTSSLCLICEQERVVFKIQELFCFVFFQAGHARCNSLLYWAFILDYLLEQCTWISASV